MLIIIKFLFFLTILLCLSTYVLYPLVILLIGKVFPFKPVLSDAKPFVSILISAYNEEKDIRQKLKNTLALDYPKERMEIIVGSDGSSDKTSLIVSEFFEYGVKLLDFKENRGKTAVQNDLVSASQHDILVFTDAASFLKKDSLSNLVRSLSDPRIGAIAGTMVFIDQKQNLTTESQGLYWKYEMKLRELESVIGRLVGVDGPLYAIKRDNFVFLGNQIISDLMSPLMVLKQDKKVILEKKAIVYEAPTTQSTQELQTRRRITLRGMIGLFSDPDLLSPFRCPLLSVQIFLHKLLRWAVGILVLLNFLLCLTFSAHPFFGFFLVLHVIFYMAALTGWILEKNGKSMPLFKIPFYFCLVNIAATLAIVDFFRKKQAVSWKPVRN